MKKMILSVQVKDRKTFEMSIVSFSVDDIDMAQEIVKKMRKNGAKVIQANVSVFMDVE